jgi:branched-chain amino acid transport system substrate-binding protein
MAGAGLLLLAACSSSKSASTTAAPSTPASTAGSTATSAGSSLHLTKPVKMVMLAEIVGESPYAVNAYHYGATIAVDEINKAGGIGGQPIQYVRLPISPLDLQQANASYLKALDQSPTVIMGLPGAGTLLAGISTNVERGGVPVLDVSPGDDSTRFGTKGATQYAWMLEPYTPATAEVATQFVVQDLGAKKVGLLGTNESYGTGGIGSSKQALAAAGLQPFATKQYSPTASDLTAEVLAMKGADAVLDWGYPNPLAVQLKQFQQNGLNIPTLSGGSSAIVADNKLATGDAISKLYAVLSCNPSGANTPALSAFASGYQQRWGEKASEEAGSSYDAVYIAKAAIEAAGSADPKAVNDALGRITVTDHLVCSSKYHADGAHNLDHEVSISSFSADGTSKVVKTLNTPDLAKAAG